MQQLLDFIHDHRFEERLYCVLRAAGGELELSWCRTSDPLHWQVRRQNSKLPADRVPRARLLVYLAEHGADLGEFERELKAAVASQIVVAHHLLTDARRALGEEVVSEALRGHEEFARELVEAVASLTAPRFTVVVGDGLQTCARSGHLALVQ
jgi:hypothetical protein